MNVRPASADEAEGLAEVHTTAFDAPWSAADLSPLMQGRGAFTLVAEREDGAVAGFILCRQIAGEAEVLTLAVRPAHRRQGVAQALMEVAIALAAASAQSMFLEVADDNAGAIALYEQAGFEPVGRRVRYYARPSGEGADAIVMRRTLNS
jgi:ribosomal-protein-alanine N-acetyltransferase